VGSPAAAKTLNEDYPINGASPRKLPAAYGKMLQPDHLKAFFP
jgi:hypothetical protein